MQLSTILAELERACDTIKLRDRTPASPAFADSHDGDGKIEKGAAMTEPTEPEGLDSPYDDGQEIAQDDATEGEDDNE